MLWRLKEDNPRGFIYVYSECRTFQGFLSRMIKREEDLQRDDQMLAILLQDERSVRRVFRRQFEGR